MKDIEDNIIRRAAEGDAEAFEAIYRAYSGFVYSVAFRMVSDKDAAAEVTQDVFLTVHRKLKGFGFLAGLKTWLYRVTFNLSVNYIRKRANEVNRRAQYDDNTDTRQAHGSADNGLIRSEDKSIIEKLLKAINPDQRACIILRHMQGHSYEEIAQILKVNINTVRTRLKRAREKFLAIRKEVVSHEV